MQQSNVLLRFHGVVDGLGYNPAIFDDERVGPVAHTRMLSLGRKRFVVPACLLMMSTPLQLFR